jgi:hypothetical protein
MNGILIEGVTGAGKSQTLAALQKHPKFSILLGNGRVFMEEETLGEVMDEINESGVGPSKHLWRLNNVLEELKHQTETQPNTCGYVLERFHLSYYALLPDWNLYAPIDEQLHSLNCKIVLLTVSPEEFAHRSLDRVDRRDTDWTAGMIAYYGSREATLDAMKTSQQRRRDALAYSRLPSIQIDTTARDWTGYAEQIIEYWQGRN